MGFHYAMSIPAISEEARQLVSTLLTKFSEGPSGQKRVTDLFQFSGVEESGRGKVLDWVKAFNEKVRQLSNPESNARYQDVWDMYSHIQPAFSRASCQRRADAVLQKIQAKSK